MTEAHELAGWLQRQIDRAETMANLNTIFAHPTYQARRDALWLADRSLMTQHANHVAQKALALAAKERNPA